MQLLPCWIEFSHFLLFVSTGHRDFTLGDLLGNKLVHEFGGGEEREREIWWGGGGGEVGIPFPSFFGPNPVPRPTFICDS